MPTMMEAAVLHAPGDLRIEQVAVPRDLGPEDVLVKVMAAGICGSDIGRVMKTGTYRFPTIPGHEFSGILAECGTGVSSARVGDRVAVAPLMPCFRCESCQHGHYSLCDCYDFLGSRTHGGFAQYVRAPARNVVKVPDAVGFDEAATVEPAGIILHGIKKIEIGAGDSVAVIGVGALGYFAVRFAKLSGAKPVIAVDVDEAKLELARGAGADFVINGANVDAAGRIREVTAGPRRRRRPGDGRATIPGRELARSRPCASKARCWSMDRRTATSSSSPSCSSEFFATRSLSSAPGTPIPCRFPAVNGSTS